MAGDDVQKELEQLRAEVAVLSAARANKKATETQAENNPNELQPTEAEEVSDIIGNTRTGKGNA